MNGMKVIEVFDVDLMELICPYESFAGFSRNFFVREKFSLLCDLVDLKTALNVRSKLLKKFSQAFILIVATFDLCL